MDDEMNHNGEIPNMNVDNMANQDQSMQDQTFDDQVSQINSTEIDSLIQNHNNQTVYDRSSMMPQNNSNAAAELSAHLASSGMAGIAAAAAIATSQQKSMLYNFEMVPAARKRQSNRILRKVQQLIVEFAVRVGQQACVIICNPKSAYKQSDDGGGCHFKVFGASPLEGVLMNFKDAICNDLEIALQNYQMCHTNTSFLQPTEIPPPLMVDGIPTPLDKMTQAQLRAFIPIMLKYSTGRNKPAWGRSTSRPPWWPDDVPWANVRSDVRTDEEKQRQSWTCALKKVVRCCYEYHGKAHYLLGYHMPPKMNSHEIMDQSHMMDQSQMMENHHHHHQQQMEYDHMQMQNSGRHIMLNEQEAVEAQLRALQTTNYSISTDQDGTISLVHLNNNLENHGDMQHPVENYCGLPDDHQLHQVSQQIKVEDLANLPPGTVVQLDSNSASKLYHFINDPNNMERMETMMLHNNEQVEPYDVANMQQAFNYNQGSDSQQIDPHDNDT